MYDFKSSDLFANLKQGKFRKLPKGQVLQLSNENMFFNLVGSGYIKRYLITQDGQQSIQVVYGPNDAFPLTPVYLELLDLSIYKGDEVLYYETITDVEVYTLSKAELKLLASQQNSIYKDLFYLSGTRLESNIQRLENTSLRAVHKRLADLLVYFCRRFGSQIHKGTNIQLPLTQQIIADMLNVSRESISIAMNHLQERGLVIIEPHHSITIPDIDALHKAH